MRIAFSVIRDIHRTGGIEKYTLEVGKRLADRGHDVTVFTTAQYPGGCGDCVGMRMLSCADFQGKFVEKLFAGGSAALKIAKSAQYDIVHQHSIAAGAFNWLARFGKPRASVLQMHGEEWRRTKWGAGARYLVRQLEAFSVRQFCHWTAVSKTQCQALSSTYGIPVRYIPTAADVLPLSEPVCIREQYGLYEGSFILFLGRLVPEKGAHTLIEAFRSVRTDQRLVIAGDAPTEPAYVQHLHDLAGRDSRILFTGNVTGRVLQELLSNCSVYVQPSVIEGLSIALLEAMSHGRCCLVTDIPENREAIGTTGVVFRQDAPHDLASQLSVLLVDGGERRQLGDAARKRVSKEFSWTRVTDELEDLYATMMAG